MTKANMCSICIYWNQPAIMKVFVTKRKYNWSSTNKYRGTSADPPQCDESSVTLKLADATRSYRCFNSDVMLMLELQGSDEWKSKKFSPTLALFSVCWDWDVTWNQTFYLPGDQWLQQDLGFSCQWKSILHISKIHRCQPLSWSWRPPWDEDQCTKNQNKDVPPEE